MNIKQYMKRQVVSIPASATLRDAAKLYSRYHVGTLPVVDEQRKLVGILYIRDLLDLIMPSFVHLGNFDFIRGDFGNFEELRPSAELFAHPIKEFMSEATYVHVTAGLLRVFAMLDAHDMADMPVIDDEHYLVGIASRVDIGTALLAGWCADEQEA